MPKHLPPAPGEPDPEARRIIELIYGYLHADRDPIAVAAGLRHIYYWAEVYSDEAIEQAKTATDPDTGRPYTFDRIREATGFVISTAQGRIAMARRRRRGAA
jgi:hypothetical protein